MRINLNQQQLAVINGNYFFIIIIMARAAMKTIAESPQDTTNKQEPHTMANTGLL